MCTYRAHIGANAASLLSCGTAHQPVRSRRLILVCWPPDFPPGFPPRIPVDTFHFVGTRASETAINRVTRYALRPFEFGDGFCFS